MRSRTLDAAGPITRTVMASERASPLPAAKPHGKPVESQTEGAACASNDVGRTL